MEAVAVAAEFSPAAAVPAVPLGAAVPPAPAPVATPLAWMASTAFSDNWVSCPRRSFCSNSNSCCFSLDFWMSYTGGIAKVVQG